MDLTGGTFDHNYQQVSSTLYHYFFIPVAFSISVSISPRERPRVNVIVTRPTPDDQTKLIIKHFRKSLDTRAGFFLGEIIQVLLCWFWLLKNLSKSFYMQYSQLIQWQKKSLVDSIDRVLPNDNFEQHVWKCYIYIVQHFLPAKIFKDF